MTWWMKYRVVSAWLGTLGRRVPARGLEKFPEVSRSRPRPSQSETTKSVTPLSTSGAERQSLSFRLPRVFGDAKSVVSGAEGGMTDLAFQTPNLAFQTTDLALQMPNLSFERQIWRSKRQICRLERQIWHLERQICHSRGALPGRGESGRTDLAFQTTDLAFGAPNLSFGTPNLVFGTPTLSFRPLPPKRQIWRPRKHVEA